MKDSGERTDGAGQLAKPNHRATISQRKLKANRDNAKKSTGPKTPRGKAFSRRNAIKHGLFLRSTANFEGLYEDPHEYNDLLKGLWDHYQPVGRVEEIEVERIALCYWRLQRACRYENAVNLAARRGFGIKQLAEQEKCCKELDKIGDAAILQLQSAKKEIEDTGEISQEVMQRIDALVPGFERMSSTRDKDARERPENESSSKWFLKLSPQMRSSIIAMRDTEISIACLERIPEQRWNDVLEIGIGQYAIPNPEALDRLLRYETTTERSLTRALDRLERLQRQQIR